MNPERLLQHFDTISEAPDAVARLRRLILDLAVRGKLVEQDAGDEPALALLERIRMDSEAITKRVPNAHRTEVPPFELPDSWVWCQLDELSSLITSGSRDWAKHYSSSGAIFVRMGNLSRDSYQLRMDTVQRVTPPAGGEGTRTQLQARDVLVSITGEVGLLGRIPADFGEAYINQHTCLIRPVVQMQGRFIPEFLRSSSAQAQFNEPQRGLKNSFRLSDVSKLRVPLPPPREQRRIIAKVDELMALCDQLQAARDTREQQRDLLVAASLHRMTANHAGEDELTEFSLCHLKSIHFHLDHLPRLSARHEHIRQLRQTILNLAVRGKLTSREAKDEASESLMRSLRGAKTAAIESGSVRARAAIDLLSLDDVRNQMPTQWGLVVFDEVLVITGGLAKGRKLSGRSLTSVPYLRVANVQRGRLDLGLIKEIEVPNEEIERYRLSDGDVLLTEGGDWDKLGRAAIWRSEIALCLHQNHVFRVRSLRPELLLPEWIEMFANGPIGISYFQNAAKQTTNLASINMAQLRACPLPIPPPAEQRRIVAKVDELMALCDQLEASLASTQADQRRLLDVLMHEALSQAA